MDGRVGSLLQPKTMSAGLCLNDDNDRQRTSTASWIALREHTKHMTRSIFSGLEVVLVIKRLR